MVYNFAQYISVRCVPFSRVKQTEKYVGNKSLQDYDRIH